MKGKVAIVTGAASGIGKATVLAFAKRGVKVVASDLHEGQAVLAEVAAIGGEAIFVLCDVSRESDVKMMVEKAVSHFGRIDYCFNNAGIEGTPALLQEMSTDNWDATISINLKGVFLCMRYEIPHLLKNGGAIVNCASIAGLVGFSNMAAYVASKHGVVGMTKTAALELAKSNVRVNAVCPGVINTPMIDRFTGGSTEAAAQLIQGQPIGRLGKPEEIAEAVVWLCSPEASLVTGVALPVDGGWTAQ